MPKTALAELEVEETEGVLSLSKTDEASPKTFPVIENDKDYFVERDGVRFAGTHVLLELWGATNLDDPKLIEETLCQGALDAGATILHAHTHHFSPYSGVSGVIVLAESHISIHTWPEKDFAAIDIFMCGDCDPMDAIPAIEKTFKPETLNVSEHRRGVIK